MFNRTRPLIAGLLSAFGVASPQYVAARHASGRARSLETIRRSIAVRYSRYEPHQGERECARRRGSADWQFVKNRSRQRRGLPFEPILPELLEE